MPRRPGAFISSFGTPFTRSRRVPRSARRAPAMPPQSAQGAAPAAPATPPTESTPLLPGGPPAAPARNDGIRWRETAVFLLPYIIPETLLLRLTAVASVLCVIATKGATLLTPVAYKLAVDTLVNNLLPGATVVVPYTAIVLFIVAKLATSVFRALQDYTYTAVASGCTQRFSISLFTHLQNLSLAFHLQRKTGEITRIMDRGTSSIETVINTVVFTMFPTLLEAVVVAGIFFKLGTPFIAVVTLLTVILYFVFTFYTTNWRIKYRRDLIETDNKVSEQTVDALINYETVKMFGMEQEESSLYARLQQAYLKAYVWFRVTLNSLNVGQSAIQSVGGGTAMVLAAVGATDGRLTPGDFVLVNTYVTQLFGPLFFLGSSYRMITQAATDLEKCVALLKTPVTVQDLPDATELEMKNEDVLAGRVGEVRFENVSFKYEGTERGSSGGLRDITFRIPPGKMLAFVGASGAGKRFYDVDSGAVLIDGKNVKNFTQASLRKQIGVVAQDTVLFNQTLRYNISYGKQDATDAQIYHAARSSALGEFLESLPQKLDTMVGERGVRLSGGERQRVGCARCIIKAPGIVLLDEASSALDTHTEREMQASLRDVCRNRTTIVIAHRLSTIMMADEIIVLGTDGVDDSLGTIIERGRHSELLKRGGKYADMWELQTSVDKEIATDIIEASNPDQ